MGNPRTKYCAFFALLGFFLLVCLVFGATFSSEEVFMASDSNLGWLAFKKSLLPELFSGTFHASPLMGDSPFKLPIFTDVLLWMLPVVFYNNLIYALLLVGASLFLLAYLRLMNRGWLSSVVGAVVALWLGSITISAAGHIGKFGVAFFGCASLYLIEKAVQHSGRLRVLLAVMSGGAVGGMLLEQQDVALLWGMLLGAYAVFRLAIPVATFKLQGCFQLLLPIAVVAILLAGPSCLQAYKTNISDAAAVAQKDAKSAAQKWNYITQWSFPPAETLGLVAPGFFGWRSGVPDGPYWGITGQSDEWKSTQRGFRNFSLDSQYIGIVPFMLAIIALIRAGREKRYKAVIWFYGISAIFIFLLACGKYTPVYRLFYALPLVNNIRAPSKFMQILQIVVGILAAFGLDAMLSNARMEKKRKKTIWILMFSLAGCFLAAAICATIGRQNWTEHFVNAGWGEASPSIVSNMIRALLHAGIMAAIAGSLAWAVQQKNYRSYVPFALVAVLIADSSMLCRHYFKTESLASYESKDAVLDFLEANTGDERVYLFDASGVFNRWVGVDFYYRDINHFNIFQMPRMAKDYQQWLQVIGNPLRLMELSSVKYASMPLQIWHQIENQPGLRNVFRPLFYFGFQQRASDVIVSVQTDASHASYVLTEYLASFPRISVKKKWQEMSDAKVCNTLKSASFNPQTTVLIAPGKENIPPQPVSSEQAIVSSVAIDRRRAKASVEQDQPGIVLFTQKHGVGWKVYVDGVEQPLLRCNYLSMGVWVDKGLHEVCFSYKPWNWGIWFQFAGLVVLMIAVSMFARYRYSKHGVD